MDVPHHAHVLLAVAADPDARVGDIAAHVGITPRATLAILHDLEAARYVGRTRVGRRTHYTVDDRGPFRHPATAAHEIGELLDIFTGAKTEKRTADGQATSDPDATFRTATGKEVKDHGQMEEDHRDDPPRGGQAG